jgi:hypothetical protein
MSDTECLFENYPHEDDLWNASYDYDDHLPHLDLRKHILLSHSVVN